MSKLTQDKSNPRAATEQNRTMLYGNIALPYARAIYDMAYEQENFEKWSSQIGLLAHIVSEKQVEKLLANPMISRKAIVDFLIKVCDGELCEEMKKFLHMLAENNRIQHLVRIALEYEKMRRGKSDIIPFEVRTAFFLNEKQMSIIENGLRSRFKKEPEIKQVVDSDIEAGVIIRSEDVLIDGSLKGKTKKLKSQLAQESLRFNSNSPQK